MTAMSQDKTEQLMDAIKACDKPAIERIGAVHACGSRIAFIRRMTRQGTAKPAGFSTNYALSRPSASTK
jgi:hypothetical protein